MRLDRYLTECGVLSRSEAARAAKLGNIMVNGTVIKDVSAHVEPGKDKYAGRQLCITQ